MTGIKPTKSHNDWCGGGGAERPQWSRMRRLPDTILFSNMEPAGMSMRSPWLAMMMTVPCEDEEEEEDKDDRDVQKCDCIQS